MVCSDQCFSKSNERIRSVGCKQANTPGWSTSFWDKNNHFFQKGLSFRSPYMFFLWM